MSRDLAADDFHPDGRSGLLTVRRPRRRLGQCRRPEHRQSHPDSVVALHLRTCRFDLAYTIGVTDCSPPRPVPDGDRKFGAGALYLTANDAAEPDRIGARRHPVRARGVARQPADAWSDTPIADDHVIANAAVQYLTGTVRSSMRLYSEPTAGWEPTNQTGVPTNRIGSRRVRAQARGRALPPDRGCCRRLVRWRGRLGAARVEIPTAFACSPPIWRGTA